MKIESMGGSGQKVLRRVLEAVVRNGSLTPTQIAEELRLPKPSVSRHLNTLVARDLVTRVRKGQHVHYSPKRTCQITYLGPLDTDRTAPSPTWGLLEWSSPHAVDWRYPLLTRVPDKTAQQSVQRLLERCDKQGFFHPWLKHHADSPNGNDRHKGDPVKDPPRAFGDPRTWWAFEFVVFGSCARGDAREESDVDLFVLGPCEDDWPYQVEDDTPVLRWSPWKDELRHLVDELNIDSPRYIDAKFSDTRDMLGPYTKQLQQKIIEEGTTVYTTTGNKFTIESMESEQHG